jgi:hypothetical protein
MITLQQYIKESLLDDLDELENDATKNVYKQNTIGKKYKIDKVYCGGDFSKLKTHFDIKKLKQLHSKYAVWESDKFDVKKRIDGSIATKNKSIINIVKLFADIVLSVDETNLTVGGRTPGVSDDLVNILSQAYVGKSKLMVWSRSESQTSELYGIIVYNDDIYDRTSLLFVIEPKQK